ncbi:MAG: undecaprenyl/decaprenyl-phosphate alpha-N-acetylglucosaminyl 1-phosphate transferase [Planctomycetes bacterium]|nr:undecaprenyl/decaprenyl-phosphate alpha-N-acetylglucosaminyl 1-phosphate transferase [Planctomycetota bacterium]
MTWTELSPIVFAIGGGLGLFALSFAIATVLVRLVRARAISWGLVDRPGDRKIHEAPMPKGGGIAVYLAAALPIALGLGAGWIFYHHTPDWVPQELAVHLPGLVGAAPTVLAILAGGAAILVLGLVDDLRGLGPWPKLAVETLVALMIVLVGIRASLFVRAHWFGGAATVIWIVLITNSFNLLDNMDGLSTGVAFVAGVLFFWATVQTGQWFVSSYLLVFLGSLAGFLRHNFPPATIFLGDAGSLYIGYQLAVLTVASSFYEPAYEFYPVALPVLVLVVPLFDTGRVVWIRWREKRPIFQGDTRHLSHRLVDLGMSRKEAVLVIYLLTLATGLGSLVLYHVKSDRGAGFLLAQLAAILALVVLLVRPGGRRSS